MIAGVAMRPTTTSLRSSRPTQPVLPPVFVPRRSSLRRGGLVDATEKLDHRIVQFVDISHRPSESRIWLDLLCKAGTKQEIDQASYSVLHRIQELLAQKNTAHCDELLKIAPVSALSTQVLLGFLAGTLKAQGYLDERARFYERVAEKLRRDEPMRAEALLRGLR